MERSKHIPSWVNADRAHLIIGLCPENVVVWFIVIWGNIGKHSRDSYCSSKPVDSQGFEFRSLECHRQVLPKFGIRIRGNLQSLWADISVILAAKWIQAFIFPESVVVVVRNQEQKHKEIRPKPPRFVSE